MKRGDFYNSTGVTLRRLDLGPKAIELEVLTEPGVDYLIEFIGTRRSADLRAAQPAAAPAESPGRQSQRYGDEVGAVLASVKGARARYEVRGDEIYVRARVTSSRPHPNPFAAGDREMAWTQPLVVPAP